MLTVALNGDGHGGVYGRNLFISSSGIGFRSDIDKFDIASKSDSSRVSSWQEEVNERALNSSISVSSPVLRLSFFKKMNISCMYVSISRTSS